MMIRRAVPLCSTRAPLLRSALASPSSIASLRCGTISALRFGSGKAEEPSKTEPPSAAASDKPMLVYEGAKNKIVTTLKMASIANLGFAVASAPILQYITAASGNSGKGVAMSALLLFFGGGTTGALTWATSTYVLKMVSVPGKDAYIVTTPTLTGGTKDTEIAWAGVTRPMSYHPFATFQVDGKIYYLDELGEMHDEGLPAKLEEALNK